MKSAVLAAVFLLLCLTSLSSAEDYPLAQLEKEAQAFAAAYTKPSGGPPNPEQADVLLQAARIMTAAGKADECAAAVNLCSKAASFATRRDAAFWTALAKAQGCVGQWPEASRSGWLAYLAAADPETKKTALTLTGKLLENRTTAAQNWTPAAISVYELLGKLGASGGAERLQKQQSELAAQKHAAEKAQQEAKLAELRRKEKEDRTLKIQGTAAEAGGSQPKLCLRFNEELPGTDTMHYGDYIQIAPAVASDFSVSDNDKLCIGGAAWGTAYTVTVRSGLKIKERTLPEAVTLTIQTEHRSPALWFNQSDYILAGRGSRAVGLHTVNMDKVRLRLFRIHERNILSEFVHEKFRTKLDQYELDNVKDRTGEQVWQGTAEIVPEQDKTMTNALVLPEEALAAPGLYILVAEKNSDDKDEEGRWEDQAAQWIVVTDIGLTTYQGSDGLTVIARSLETAQPIAGLEIGLYARNNTPLARLTTDAEGQVRFAPGLLKGKGGQAAVHLLSADSKYGFTFLQLEQAPFDLSDRGVGGRAAPGPLDAFVYTERGIYRPGETVNIVALLRDQLGRAAANPPLTLRLSGPDGKVMRERLLQPDPTGAYADTVNLAVSARSGDWTAALYADVEEKAVGQVSFQVKSFKPPRLEVRLEPKGLLSPGGEKGEVAVQADYFYGSPGSELTVQAKMQLQHDPHPFAEFAAFTFGRADEKPEISEIELEGLSTDEKGHGVLTAALDGQEAKTLQPLKAVISADVLDIDGRAVSASVSLPVRHLPEYVGVKPRFSDQHLPEQSQAAFEVIVLDAKGQPQPKGQLAYRLVREEIDWQWFQKDGEWGYEQIIRDQEEQRGQLAWEKAGPASLALPAGQGSYRLELLAGDSAVLRTSFRFTAGEQLLGRSDTPDSVKVMLDRQGYKAGDTAKLTLTAPYSGQASLVLANSTVNGVRNFTLTGKEQTLDIPVEDSWGAGVYALVTIYRPGKEGQKGADRAVGLVWLPVEPAAQRLEVSVNSPEHVRPRQTVQVPVAVKGAEAGGEVRLTLAAVDEGVLQLTGFVSPDPIAWFFGKQQLGLEIRDLYGQLIIPPDSKPLTLRSGAGEDALRGAPQSNVKVVSLFSGLVQAGPDGMASVPLAIPDFNGKLRLMAVAWSKGKTGSASRALRVNDPVVISPSLPRYLANGDRASLSLLLENIDGPAGDYLINWTAQGAVVMDKQAGTAVATLQPGKRQGLSFPVEASGIGSGSLHLSVTGPEGYSYQGDFALNVRGKNLPVLLRTYSKLDPGATITLNKDTVNGLFPETARVNISISSAPNVDVAGLLAELDRYPHGCLEQLTSRAMPLLYANQLAERFGCPVDKNLPGRVQEAIDLILQKQRGEGSFGLWSDTSDEEPWLSAYAMDFFSRAREKGYTVPDYFYNKGLQWLSGQVKASSDPKDTELAALAYAHWVLARAGQGRHEDARYLFDAQFAKIASPLAQAQLAGTLALLGDQGRAVKGLTAALRAADTEASWWNYGSRLRDLAGIISIIAEAKQQTDPAPAWQELTGLLSKRKYFSTQEQAALIMAALTLEKGQPLDLELAGSESPKPPQAEEKPSLFGRVLSAFSLDEDKPKAEQPQPPEKKSDFFSLSRSGAELLASSTTVRNKGTAAVWVVTVAQGSLIAEPAPVENGFTVQRSWYTPAGEPLSLDKVAQGDLAVVMLEGQAQEGGNFQSLLLDLLPAGFEIEKAITEVGEGSPFSWVTVSPFRYTDARDDRFVAAFDTADLEPVAGNAKVRPFSFAYLVRAVTPGTYAVPPPEVEAMYRPEYRARNTGGVVTVVRKE